MDFIERLTGWNPDQGNGQLELYIYMIIAVLIVSAGLYVWSTRVRSREHVGHR